MQCIHKTGDSEDPLLSEVSSVFSPSHWNGALGHTCKYLSGEPSHPIHFQSVQAKGNNIFLWKSKLQGGVAWISTSVNFDLYWICDWALTLLLSTLSLCASKHIRTLEHLHWSSQSFLLSSLLNSFPSAVNHHHYPLLFLFSFLLIISTQSKLFCSITDFQISA